MTSKDSFIKKLLSWKFNLYLLAQLPMGWLAGLKIVQLDSSLCSVSVNYWWLTKNPFKSMYFAVQSMAAELSTAAHCLLAVQNIKPSVAFIIVDLKAQFYKKATGKVFFTCIGGLEANKAVEKAVSSQESQSVTLKTEGKMKDGTVVSVFEFTWSFKQRY